EERSSDFTQNRLRRMAAPVRVVCQISDDRNLTANPELVPLIWVCGFWSSAVRFQTARLSCRLQALTSIASPPTAFATAKPECPGCEIDSLIPVSISLFARRNSLVT